MAKNNAKRDTTAENCATTKLVAVDQAKANAVLETLGTGEKVGKLPAFIGMKALKALGHPESPIRAIRAKCLDCSGGHQSEVRKCVAYRCALWPMRMGVNPFHGRGSA